MRSTLVGLALGIALPALAVPVRQVDWKQFDFGEGQKLVDGEWSKTAEDDSYTETLSLEGVLYVDLDGDGKEEAVAHTLYCGGGTGRFDSVDIFQAAEPLPIKIGSLPGGDRGDGGVSDLKVTGREVVLTRNASLPNDGACCPTLEFDETWAWKNGGPALRPGSIRVRSAIEADSDTSYDVQRKAGLDALAKDPAQAAASFRAALALRPGDPTALQELGLALMKADSSVAVPVLQHALVVAEGKLKPAVYYNLGKAWLRSDRPQEAVEAFEASLALRPDNAPTVVALAEARSKLKGAGKPAIEPKKMK